jgi:hypothetical protein
MSENLGYLGCFLFINIGWVDIKVGQRKGGQRGSNAGNEILKNEK